MARLGDSYSAIGTKAMAKAVWWRALAILEELRGHVSRGRAGVAPYRPWYCSRS